MPELPPFDHCGCESVLCSNMDGCPRNDEYVNDDCVCAKDTCDECNPAEANLFSRPAATPFYDDLKANILGSCHDTINASWNAWEQACKYQDPKLQEYYLDMVGIVSQFQKKLMNLKKKNV